MGKAGISVPFVVLVPTTEEGVPNGALFFDSDNGNAPTIKLVSGVTEPMGSGSESLSLFTKIMQASGAIAVNAPISKRSDGKIEPGDSDAPGGKKVVGVAAAVAAADGDLIAVTLAGPNIPGALTGLGFAPGDEIYVSEGGGGYTNDLESFTDGNDRIIKIGIADCAAGEASGTATDLIVITEVLGEF